MSEQSNSKCNSWGFEIFHDLMIKFISDTAVCYQWSYGSHTLIHPNDIHHMCHYLVSISFSFTMSIVLPAVNDVNAITWVSHLCLIRGVLPIVMLPHIQMSLFMAHLLLHILISAKDNEYRYSLTNNSLLTDLVYIIQCFCHCRFGGGVWGWGVGGGGGGGVGGGGGGGAAWLFNNKLTNTLRVSYWKYYNGFYSYALHMKVCSCSTYFFYI